MQSNVNQQTSAYPPLPQIPVTYSGSSIQRPVVAPIQQSEVKAPLPNQAMPPPPQSQQQSPAAKIDPTQMPSPLDPQKEDQLLYKSSETPYFTLSDKLPPLPTTDFRAIDSGIKFVTLFLCSLLFCRKFFTKIHESYFKLHSNIK